MPFSVDNLTLSIYYSIALVRLLDEAVGAIRELPPQDSTFLIYYSIERACLPINLMIEGKSLWTSKTKYPPV